MEGKDKNSKKLTPEEKAKRNKLLIWGLVTIFGITAFVAGIFSLIYLL